MTILLILLNLVLAVLLLWYKKLYVTGSNKYFSLAYFLLKCICGYAVFFIYHEYFHRGDVFSYLNDAEIIYKLLKENPSAFFQIITGSSADNIPALLSWNESTYNSFFSDNHTVILLNVLIRFVSFGNVAVHVIWMNVLSYIGLLWLFRAVQNNFRTIKSNLLIFVPFFLPSVLIWSSSISKEPLMIFALGALFYSLQLYFSEPEKNAALKVIVSMFLFLFVKSYILILLLPGIVAWIISSKIKVWKPSFVFFSVYIIGLIELLIAGNFFPSLNLPAFLFGQQLSNLRYAIMFSAQSIVNPVLLAPTALSFLIHIPEAIAFAFFHPYISEMKQWWMIPLAIEPYLIFALFVLQFKKIISGFKKASSVSWLAFYAALMLMILLGFTVPVLGTLARLKMPALLLLSIAIFSCCSTQKGNGNYNQDN